MSYTNNSKLLAAVDIGSNSIHLTVAKQSAQGFRILKRFGRKAQLAAGLNDDASLSEAAMARGLQCLQEIANELPPIQAEQISIVATCALRLARNRDQFVQQAQNILGFPIAIIDGKEEARLIYLGASKARQRREQQLVIDIGGGSTELIIGQGDSALLLASLDLGCIHFSQHFFTDGEISPQHFDQATAAASARLKEIQPSYIQLGWQHCIGTSGTAQAAMQVLQKMGYDFNAEGLHHLKRQLCQIGHISQIQLAGLKPDRRSIFVGGVAILLALFEVFALDRMQYVDSALREGLLWDLVERR